MPSKRPRSSGEPPLPTGPPARKPGVRPAPPPELTHREALWYLRQVEEARPLVLRLRDGEELVGILEWYDRAAYRLRLDDGGHLIVQKSAVQSLRRA